VQSAWTGSLRTLLSRWYQHLQAQTTVDFFVKKGSRKKITLLVRWLRWTPNIPENPKVKSSLSRKSALPSSFDEAWRKPTSYSTAHCSIKAQQMPWIVFCLFLPVNISAVKNCLGSLLRKIYVSLNRWFSSYVLVNTPYVKAEASSGDSHQQTSFRKCEACWRKLFILPSFHLTLDSYFFHVPDIELGRLDNCQQFAAFWHRCTHHRGLLGNFVIPVGGKSKH